MHILFLLTAAYSWKGETIVISRIDLDMDLVNQEFEGIE